jgi:hypothetical protein
MKLPLTFEMTATRAELLRLLPAAVNHAPFVEEDGALVHREGTRGWRISLTLLPQLRVGAVRLERYRLDFDFAGYSDEEIEDIIEGFEIAFRRGGGGAEG